jgi:hypothetical protein
MSLTRTFGAWLLDVRIGRTTNWPGFGPPEPGQTLGPRRGAISLGGEPMSEQAASLVRCRGVGVLLRNACDRTGGPI